MRRTYSDSRWLLLLWAVGLLAFLAGPILTQAQEKPAGPDSPDSILLPPGVEAAKPDEENFASSADAVKITTAWPATAFKPGDQTWLAVVIDIHPRFKIQSNYAKEPYIPTRILVKKLPDGLKAATTQFPAPVTIDFGGEKIDVFKKQMIAFIPVKIGEKTSSGDLDILLSVTIQACDDMFCLIPSDVEVKAKLPLAAEGQTPVPANTELFAGLRETGKVKFDLFDWSFTIDPSGVGFLLFLLVACLGGFLLNFTPCVLPLIPIKIIGISQTAGNRARSATLGMAMFAGVTLFWLALALAIINITGFNAVNTLFQKPGFTITVGLVIFAMAVGMMGLFTVRLPQWVYAVNPRHDSIGGAVGFGVMTAVLSTPCTAPFMGAAITWAVDKSPATTLATFAAVGIGMGLPYLVLASFPALVKKMPRTGPASDLIKQVMGVLMMAAGAYFLGVGIAGQIVSPPDPPSRLYWWFVALFIAAAGALLTVRTLRITRCPGRRIAFGGLGLLFILGAIGMGIRFTDKGPIDWIYYTPERLEAARQRGKAIVLEFTAEWCLNCKALEETVLKSPQVADLLKIELGIAPIKVDLTGNNVLGDKKLSECGSRTIPLLVIYTPEGREVFRGDNYTISQVVNALKQAGGKPDPAGAKLPPISAIK